MAMMAQQACAQQQQQKRTAAEAESLLVGVKAIVFDVEGTMIPITFVKDTFVPYCRDNVEKHLTETFEDAETIKDVAALRDLSQKEKESGVEGVVQIPAAADGKEEVIKAVVENVRWQIEKERDSAELRQFQNHVWRHGYEFGGIRGEMFDDVPPMLRMLSEEGFTLFVFSCGCADIQKMLFATTNEGDITDVFSNFFDASFGCKTDCETYKKLAAEIKFPADEILYLTGTPEEAAAAVAAGLRSALVIRPGNADLTDEHLQNFACIEQLDELYGEDDEEDYKRMHGDNGEAEDDEDDDENEDEVDEDEEGEEDEGEGEGEGDDA